MAKKLVFVGVFLISLFIFPGNVLAACNPPTDYRGCQPVVIGTNGPQLMDQQYKPVETDFKSIRDMANSAGMTNNRVPATIIVTDGTAGNHETLLQIYKNADKYGVDLVIRTWGNNPDVPVAGKMGEDFSAVNKLAQQAGVTVPTRIEMGNEVNAFAGNTDGVSGSKYAEAFSAFVKGCSSCNVVLPSMGGPPSAADSKNQFIKDFLAKVDTATLRQVDGIVFNSYGETAEKAATDWLNTLQMWKDAAGNKINFSGLDYYLTEIGPADPTAENKNVGVEMEAIARQLLALEGTAAFSQLKGASFFLWDKNQNVILVTVDPKTGKISLRIAGKSNNLPGQIPLGDNYPSAKLKKAGCYAGNNSWYPDESLENCPSDACSPALSQDTPLYYKADGSVVPEMRTDAGFKFGQPVQGLACGQARSDSFVIPEVAPYDLFKKTAPDLCEGNLDSLHAWVGEIMPVGIQMPFAQPLAEHWAGKFDAEHYTEKEIEDIRALARSNSPTISTTNIKSSLPTTENDLSLVPLAVASGPIGEMPIEGDPFKGNPSSDPQLNPQQGPRQWTETNEAKGLIECGYPEGEPPDGERAPQLGTLAGSDPTKDFTTSYKVNDSNWAVSFQCMKANNANVTAPQTGYDIGGGYNYLVLYADDNFITLGNFRMDEQNNPQAYGAVLPGYTLHLSNINVDPNIIAAYKRADAAGRRSLPAIRMGDAVGQPQNGELCVSIRDSDDFMDPRSKLDWWNAYKDSPNAGICKGGGKGSSKKKMTPQAAREKIFQETGVLGKLLPKETQDSLKADFIRYVKTRPAKSLYQNFAIYGQTLVGMENPPAKTDFAGIRAWAERNRKTLDMMGLFPNENVLAQIKVVVCGDREYEDITMRPPYPEVMKMGLAANQLFQILSPEESQEIFYKSFPRLKDPLTNISNGYLANADTNGEAIKPMAVVSEPVAVKKQEDNIFSRIGNFFTGLFGKAEKVFAETRDGCFSVSSKIDPVTNFDGSVDVNYTICITGKVHLGSHVQLFAGLPGEKANDPYNNGIKGLGTKMAVTLQAGKTDCFSSANLGGPVHLSKEQANLKVGFSAKLDECNDLGNQDYSYCDPVTGICDKVAPPVSQIPGPPFACDSSVACCLTPSCAPKLFKNVQYGPPITMNPGNYGADLYFGASFDPGKAGDGPGGSILEGVKLIFKKEDWKKYTDKNVLPDECSFVNYKPEDPETCNVNRDCSTWGSSGGFGCNKGICTPFSCAHGYNRTVDIYSNVPYLYSMWEQVTGSCLKECLSGGSFIMECQNSCQGREYSGFLNYFKPELKQTKAPSTAETSGNVGCFTDDAKVFDQYNNFKPVAGATELGWANFHLFHTGIYPKDIGVITSQDIKTKLLFYRIGGVCNADKWFSEKILNPARKQ